MIGRGHLVDGEMVKPVTDLEEENEDAQFEGESVPRDLFFDPWLIVHRCGSRRHPFVEQVVGSLSRIEDRKRSRRGADHERHCDLVETLIANLAISILSGPPFRAVAVTLAKPESERSRYERGILRKLPDTLRGLQNSGLINLWISRERNKVSTMTPTVALVAMARVYNFTGADLARAAGEETVILSQTERDHVARTERRHLINYHDTAETRRFRAELTQINDHLADADIAFLVNDGAVNVSQRRLRRIFNVPSWMPCDTVRFDMGGRLFDGWWQRIKGERRHLIRIDGEAICDLDYSSMYTRLAYLHVGEMPPEGDLYRAIAGIETEDHRDGIKQVINALLCRMGAFQRLSSEAKSLLPLSLQSAKSVRAAVLAAHPALASVIEAGLGFEFMKTESDIMVALLLRLASIGITALPMHDGIMTAHSLADIATEVMGDISEELLGYRLPVKAKKLS